MTNALATILAAAETTETGLRTQVPADWKQGRTAYGGFSAALALAAAHRVAPDLPPLRSAQIAFVGPLDGAIAVSAQTLRRGRNAAFVQADVTGEAGLGMRATFVFMSARNSAIGHGAADPAPVAAPAADARSFSGPPGFFASNFDYVDPLPADPAPAEWLRWTRLHERDGLDPMVELMAIGDALPPGAMRLAGLGGMPVSSLNWHINLLTAEPATRDGWWLLGTRADHVGDGFSSQRMAIWNADGAMVAEAIQAVAIFG